MSHGKRDLNEDIKANNEFCERMRIEADERKKKRDAFLRERDEEYARLFPENLKHKKYKSNYN